MIQTDELKQKLENTKRMLDEAASALNIDDLSKELADLRASMEVPGFWDDIAAANKVNKKIKPIEDKLETTCKDDSTNL